MLTIWLPFFHVKPFLAKKIEVGSTLSIPVWKFGRAWAKKKFGDPTYRDIGALGTLKKKESKTVKTLVTMRFDEKNYYVC